MNKKLQRLEAITRQRAQAAWQRACSLGHVGRDDLDALTAALECDIAGGAFFVDDPGAFAAMDKLITGFSMLQLSERRLIDASLQNG